MLSVLITLCLSPQDPAASPGNAVFEVFPLQHLCGARTGLTPPPWGTMLTYTADSDQRPDLLGAQSDEAQFHAEHVVQWLQGLHQKSTEEGLLRLEAAGDCLHVFGDRATVALLGEQLRELAGLIVRPLQVEVCLWDATGTQAPPAVLGPRDYAQFAADRVPLWRSVATTRSAMPVALDRQRWVRYVRSIDVEVAQKQDIAQPVTNAFLEGGRVVVAPHLLVGGDDVVVHVQFGLAQRRGSVRTVASGVPGSTDLDLPELESLYGGCSARLPNGGAIAVSLQGHAQTGGQHVLTVRVSGRTPPVVRPPAGIGIFPTSAFTSGALTQRLSPPSPYPTIGDRSPDAGDMHEPEAGFGFMPQEQLAELVRNSLGADAEQDFAMDGAGGYLFVRTNPAGLARVETLLRGLQERLLRTVTVRHTARTAVGGADAGAAANAGPTLHDVQLPTLLGREVLVCRMLETNVVRDLFVEIAQEASAVAPAVETMQVGSWLRLRAVPQDATCHVQMLAQCTFGTPPPPRSMQPAGVLMLADVGSTRTAHDGTVASGQAVDHGDGPAVVLDGRSYRSALVTTVAW